MSSLFECIQHRKLLEGGGWGVKFFQEKKQLCSPLSTHEELKVSQLCYLHVYRTSEHELPYGSVSYTKATLQNKETNQRKSIDIHLKSNTYKGEKKMLSC